MSDTVFNSSFWFENDTYEEYEDYTYNPRKKQDRDDFSSFLIANLKELEFKKIKKKRKSNTCFEYQFESDKKQKIRVIDDNDGIHIIALYDNKENNDIDEEIVDRDKGQIFKIVMDRIMDALEVIECGMFDLETKTKTNLARTQNQIKQSKEKIKRKIKKDKKIDDESDYDEDEEDEPEEEEEEEDESESESESIEEFVTTKRRSARINSKKTIKKNTKRKRKRKRKKTESDNDNDSDSEGSIDEKPKRKKRKLNKSEFRKMKRDFVKNWNSKQYVEAVHGAEDEYNMTLKEINDLIEDINDDL